MEFLELPAHFLNNLDIVWTFMLLSTRYTGFMLMVPGIGMGQRGMTVRVAAIVIFSFVSLSSSAPAQLPANMVLLGVQIASELMFGVLIGTIPLFLTTGVQMAAQLASTSMGLGASQLIDPSSGITVSDLSRIYGDIVIVMFLFLGGHHVAIYAVSGLGGKIVPGTFLIGEQSIGLLLGQFGDIFRIGVMISAPVIVALLLTQFVMGLIARAVPTVNVFIVSFPLTIGIGLMLSLLALPEVLTFVARELATLEPAILAVSKDTTLIGP